MSTGIYKLKNTRLIGHGIYFSPKFSIIWVWIKRYFLVIIILIDAQIWFLATQLKGFRFRQMSNCISISDRQSSGFPIFIQGQWVEWNNQTKFNTTNPRTNLGTTRGFFVLGWRFQSPIIIAKSIQNFMSKTTFNLSWIG